MKSVSIDTFSFTLRPGAEKLPIEEFRYRENGEVRIARIERVEEMEDGRQVVRGSAYEDIHGQAEFLPELTILSQFRNGYRLDPDQSVDQVDIQLTDIRDLN
jgi:hypothetical protein